MRWVLLILVLGVLACGDGDPPHEPLISGDVTGNFEGTIFAVAEGVADEVDGSAVILLGTDAIHCDSAELLRPPKGYFAAISPPSFEVGGYGGVRVVVYANDGSLNGAGDDGGTIEITASDASSVAGSVEYSYLDSDANRYALNGTFEVVRCAPQ